MEPTGKPRVKICCIGSVAEARLAIHYGASALGLVSEMPSGPGPIAEEEIARIAVTVPPPVLPVLLTSKQDAAAIIAQQRRCGVGAIQLVDRLITGSYRDLRAALPGIRLIQVIHVGGEESFEEAVAIAPQVDALLLDSGNQSLPIKELGGTGRVHDWQISRAIREAVDVPVFLAGGLTASNIAEAVSVVGPFALDVCSGVRVNGALDEARLASFFDRLARL
ncbi:MAG TPA: phosphoribosylanthranilate isomerase [Ktedonobacterales bacterium]